MGNITVRTFWTCSCGYKDMFFQVEPVECDKCKLGFPAMGRMENELEYRIEQHFGGGLNNE